MKVLRSILIYTLAALVLVSSTSFSVGIHYCMGEVKEVSLSKNSDGCAMQESLPPCHRKHAMPCCEDHTVIHKADDCKQTLNHFHFTALPIVQVSSLVALAEVIPAITPRSSADHYIPPLPTSDRVVQLQVFLI